MKKNKSNLIESEKKRYMQLIEFTFAGDVKPDDVIVEDEDEDDAPDMADAGDDDFNNDKLSDAPDDNIDEPIDGEDNVEGTDAIEDDEFNDEDFGVEDFNDENLDSEVMNDEPAEEIDITELVNATEDAKMAAEESTQKTIELAGGLDKLMAGFETLSNQIKKMDVINDKIELLGQEIEARNPTPVEKLEMRSLDSYPYNVQLTDYWKGVGDNYEPNEEEEFSLTQNDINDEYNESEARNSFSLSKLKENTNINIYDEMLSTLKKKEIISESNGLYAVIQWYGANDKEDYNDNRLKSKIIRKVKDITGSLLEKDASYILVKRDIEIKEATEIKNLQPNLFKIIPMAKYNDYYIYDENGKPLSFL